MNEPSRAIGLVLEGETIELRRGSTALEKGMKVGGRIKVWFFRSTVTNSVMCRVPPFTDRKENDMT